MTGRKKLFTLSQGHQKWLAISRIGISGLVSILSAISFILGSISLIILASKKSNLRGAKMLYENIPSSIIMSIFLASFSVVLLIVCIAEMANGSRRKFKPAWSQALQFIVLFVTFIMIFASCIAFGRDYSSWQGIMQECKGVEEMFSEVFCQQTLSVLGLNVSLSISMIICTFCMIGVAIMSSVQQYLATKVGDFELEEETEESIVISSTA